MPRVLVPLDGSQATFAALDDAMALFAGTPDLHVTLLNVTNDGFEGAPEHVIEQFEEDAEDEIFPTAKSSNEALAAAAARPSLAGATVHKKRVTGNVVESILAACADHDVLVMHALGRSNWKDRITLSQTERIARLSPCAVLLAGEP